MDPSERAALAHNESIQPLTGAVGVMVETHCKVRAHSGQKDLSGHGEVRMGVHFDRRYLKRPTRACNVQESWQQTLSQRWRKITNKRTVMIAAFVILVGLISALVLLDEAGLMPSAAHYHSAMFL